MTLPHQVFHKIPRSYRVLNLPRWLSSSWHREQERETQHYERSDAAMRDGAAGGTEGGVWSETAAELPT